MEQEQRTDQLITKYFFGELSDEERRQLEEVYFTDAKFLERMRAVEAELIEDYLRGLLSKEAAAKLEQHMLGSPHQQRKLDFAKSMLRVAPEQLQEITVTGGKAKHSSFAQVMRRYLFSPTAAALAALAIMFSFAAWLVFDVNRLRREVGELQKEQTEARARERALKEELARQQLNKPNHPAPVEREPTDERTVPEPELEPSPVPPSASEPTVATVLSPVLSRTGGEPPKQVEILNRNPTVQLQLLYEGVASSNYDAVLETADGDELLVKTNLTAERAGDKIMVKLEIPSNQLRNRTYVVTLRSSSGTDLARYTFLATKK